MKLASRLYTLKNSSLLERLILGSVYISLAIVKIFLSLLFKILYRLTKGIEQLYINKLTPLKIRLESYLYKRACLIFDLNIQYGYTKSFQEESETIIVLFFKIRDFVLKKVKLFKRIKKSFFGKKTAKIINDIYNYIKRIASKNISLLVEGSTWLHALFKQPKY